MVQPSNFQRLHSFQAVVDALEYYAGISNIPDFRRRMLYSFTLKFIFLRYQEKWYNVARTQFGYNN